MLTNYLWNLVALKIINWKYWYMYFQLAMGETTTFWTTQSESPICKMPSYLVISRQSIWNNGLWCINTYSKSFSSNNILTKIMPNCVVSLMFTDGLASLCSYRSDMMTLSNENIFGVTGPLCGKFTGDRWIPLTKASHAELWCFLWSAPEQTDEQTIGTPVIWDAIALIMTSL